MGLWYTLTQSLRSVLKGKMENSDMHTFNFSTAFYVRTFNYF